MFFYTLLNKSRLVKNCGFANVSTESEKLGLWQITRPFFNQINLSNTYNQRETLKIKKTKQQV